MKPRITSAILILAIFAVLTSLYLTACNVVQQKAWGQFAVRTLGSVAVNTLTNIAAQEMTGSKSDYGHAASQALWQNANVVVNGNELYDLLQGATDGRLPATTKAAVQTFAIAAQNPNGKTKADAINALAATISEAAVNAGRRHD